MILTYLGIDAALKISWGLEGVYHPEVVLRKRRSDEDWSRAAELSSRLGLGETFRLPDRDFVRALSPWRRFAPNQALDRTALGVPSVCLPTASRSLSLGR